MRARAMRAGAVALALTCAAPAVAQPAKPPPTAAINRPIPALYWAKLSAILGRRMSPFPKGLSAQVRVYLDESGAITQAVFLRHSGVDVFDRILERMLADHAPTAEQRLPVPTEPKMRASVLKEGVSVVIRSRPKDTRRINLPTNLKKLEKPAKPANPE